MTELLESEDFAIGVAVGINLYQSKVITAHEREEPLRIGGELYYLQNGRERLEQIINRICR